MPLMNYGEDKHLLANPLEYSGVLDFMGEARSLLRELPYLVKPSLTIVVYTYTVLLALNFSQRESTYMKSSIFKFQSLTFASSKLFYVFGHMNFPCT